MLISLVVVRRNELIHVKLMYVNKTTDSGTDELLQTSKLLWLLLWHIARHDVTALPSSHLWFLISLRMTSKPSLWPNMILGLIFHYWSSHWSSITISGTHQACSCVRILHLFSTLPIIFFHPQTYMTISSIHSRQVSDEMSLLLGTDMHNSPPLWKRASLSHYINPLWCFGFCATLKTHGIFKSLFLSLKQKLYEGRDFVMFIAVFLLLGTIPGI